ncbi:MAG: phosphate butyryltransferase, partial [Clostridiales bacterium]
MVYQNYQQVVAAVQQHAGRRVMAVASAADKQVLEAVVDAKNRQIAEAILIGNRRNIQEILIELSANPGDYMICDVADSVAAGQRAVELVRDGEANVLMKGMME